MIRFFDDQIAESNRELARDMRQGRDYGYRYDVEGEWRYGRGRIQGGVQPVGGRQISDERRELDELQRLRQQYLAYRGRFDQQALGAKWNIVQRQIQMEQQEVREDRQWLQAQGWTDPLREF